MRTLLVATLCVVYKIVFVFIFDSLLFNFDSLPISVILICCLFIPLIPAAMSSEYKGLQLTPPDVTRLDLIRHLDYIAESVNGVRVTYDTDPGHLHVCVSPAMWALVTHCNNDRFRYVRASGEKPSHYRYTLPFKRSMTNRKSVKFHPRLVPDLDVVALGWSQESEGVFKMGEWTCNLIAGTARKIFDGDIEIGPDTFTLNHKTFPMRQDKDYMGPFKVITVNTPEGRKVSIKWRHEEAAIIARHVHEAALVKMDWFIDAKREFVQWETYCNNSSIVSFSLEK